MSIEQPPTRSILFVCTGNTCRSPLAEVLCKRLLAERLECAESELAERGFRVRSAGVAAYPGDAASEYSVQVAEEFGANLQEHRSQPVNLELLEEASLIVAMTNSHAAMLLMRFPNLQKPVRLLCGVDGDLPDPIGGDLDQYRECGRIIHQYLERILAEWLIP